MRTRTIRLRGTAIAVVVAASGLTTSYPLVAQQPVPESAPIAPYRPPRIALVQPGADATLPQDRPVVVFRFMPGEPEDPIDASSFRVLVDGVDRTQRFQIAAGEAWGPLGDGAVARTAEVLSERDTAHAIAVGRHHLSARICSSRGACATVEHSITVVPPHAASSAADSTQRSSRRARVIDALLDGLKRILNP